MLRIVFSSPNSILSHGPFLLATYGYWFAREALYPNLLLLLLSTLKANQRIAIVNFVNSAVEVSLRSISSALNGIKGYFSWIRHSVRIGTNTSNDLPTIEGISVDQLQTEMSIEPQDSTFQQNHRLSQSTDLQLWDNQGFPSPYMALLSYYTASILFLPVETYFLRRLAHYYVPIMGSRVPELIPLSLLPWHGHKNLGSWVSKLGLCLAIDYIIKASF
jgi:hypothetical protein